MDSCLHEKSLPSGTDVRWTAHTRVALDCQWLREIPGSRLEYAQPQRIEMPWTAVLDCRASLSPLGRPVVRVRAEIEAGPPAPAAPGECGEAVAALEERIRAVAADAVERACSVEIARRLEEDPGGGLPGSAVGPVTWLELQLPVVGKRRWLERSGWLRDAVVEAGEWGRLQVIPPGEESRAAYAALHAAACAVTASAAGGGGLTLGFADRRSVPRREAGWVLAPLLRACSIPASGVELAAALPGSWENLRIEAALRVEARAGRGWSGMPPERTRAFYKAMSPVSLALQGALRLWLPYLYFQDAARYSQSESANGMLVYEASRPFVRRDAAEFHYDVMCPSSLDLAFKGVGGPLAESLRRVRQRLAAAGLGQLAAPFAQKEAPRILASVRRGPKAFRGLLAADASFVDQFVKLGHRAREAARRREAGDQDAGRCMYRFLAEFAGEIRGRLRRSLASEDFGPLAPLLVVEATGAIGAFAGEDAPVETVVRIGDAAAPGEGELICLGRTPGGDARRPV